jgi:hypothetical protein
VHSKFLLIESAWAVIDIPPLPPDRVLRLRQDCGPVNEKVVFPMLFTRQRLLLTLLDVLGQPCSATDFQKLLFLYTREQDDPPSYDFVPYRFGSFSFTSYADKRRLIAVGLLENEENRWALTETGRTQAREHSYEARAVARFVRQWSNLRGDALVAEVYRRHPY